jgi:DNA-binding NarL/FixJ family response regulator
VRVVIADDSVLLREGVARILSHAGLTVVASVGDPEALLACVDREQPDVAVVDIRMPPDFRDEGLRAVATIRERHGSAIGCLVLSQHLDTRFAFDLVTRAQGGLGYLLKERVADVEDFVDAVRRVGRGGSIVDPDAVRAVVDRRSRDVLTALTDREREVLELMADGRSNAAIGSRLGIGAKTVEARINAIFSKLGLEPAADDNRRVLAVLSFLREDPAA